MEGISKKANSKKCLMNTVSLQKKRKERQGVTLQMCQGKTQRHRTDTMTDKAQIFTYCGCSALRKPKCSRAILLEDENAQGPDCLHSE